MQLKKKLPSHINTPTTTSEIVSNCSIREIFENSLRNKEKPKSRFSANLDSLRTNRFMDDLLSSVDEKEKCYSLSLRRYPDQNTYFEFKKRHLSAYRYYELEDAYKEEKYNMGNLIKMKNNIFFLFIRNIFI